MAIFWVRVEGRVLRFYRASFRVVFGTSNIRFVVGGSGTILAFPRHSYSDLDRRFLRGEFRVHAPARDGKTVRSSSSGNVRGFGSVFSAGYFISLPKCEIDPTTRLVFLGIICDSVACRFEAPEDKLEKLEVILTEAVTSGAITFRMLEKLAGKCTSLSVAVPVAALYTHHMYRQIAIFQRTGRRKKSMEIDIPKNGGLMFELTKWLEVRQRFNGASWYRAEYKMVTLTGATDASSSGWGGLIRNPGREVFRAGGDFPVDMASTHINLQEGYALQQTLEMYCADHSAQIVGSTLVSDIDNKVFHDSFKWGRAKNTFMHGMIVDSFWL